MVWDRVAGMGVDEVVVTKENTMVTELDKDTLFNTIKEDGFLHIVMYYGKTCGPCVLTKPTLEMVEQYFSSLDAKIKFYSFHCWQDDHRAFLAEHNMTMKGVPTFVAYYQGENIFQRSGGFGTKVPLLNTVFQVMDAVKRTIGVTL